VKLKLAGPFLLDQYPFIVPTREELPPADVLGELGKGDAVGLF
jgi:hypothetical protein